MKLRLFILRTLLAPLLIFAAGIVTSPSPGHAQTPCSNIQTQNETFETEVIRLVNQERTARGLAPLRANSNLTNAARAHNADMITNGFFDHTGSNGSRPGERACAYGYTPYGWGACYVAENIGAGYANPASVVAGWMNSTGHRDNILNPAYREVGVGYNTGGSWGHYWTMDPGSQPFALPVFINNDAAETTSNQVTLTLTQEDVSGYGSIGDITGVQISQDPNFSDAVWQPWSPTVTFNLTHGNGLKTIYVKFTDGVTEVISADSITLVEVVSSLEVAPANISFVSKAGSGQPLVADIPLQINNNGGETLRWTANSDQSWVQLSNNSGDAPNTITISINNSTGIFNGPAGTVVTANITVAATNLGARNTPQTIPVTVRIVETLYPVYLPVVLR